MRMLAILPPPHASTEGSIRSKGTLYFVLHPHGLTMKGRWAGLGHDGKIMTGWGSMARTQDDAEAVVAQLNTEDEGIPAP
jgi:hypothetical protein